MKTNVRWEQFRQASQIHGGAIKMCLAALGVRLSRLPIPSRRLRERVYRSIYGRKYHALNEEELDRPLAEFRSINELFTRGVRPERRPISDVPGQIVCPCDGVVQEVGELRDETLLTVKGIEYSLTSLLPGIDVDQFRDGAFAILFLSPADCHRVFAPEAGEIREVLHVPGRRLLVHPPFQRKEFPVFTLNERIIMRLATRRGDCILVLVAGWGVGNITYPFDVPLKPRRNRVSHHRLTPPRLVRRGEWIATFELGSTVILITQPNEAITSALSRDEHVVYGQPAFTFPATVE